MRSVGSSVTVIETEVVKAAEVEALEVVSVPMHYTVRITQPIRASFS